MLKQFKTTFSNFIKDEELRNDQKFHYFLYFSNWNLFNWNNKSLTSLKDILEEDFNLFEYEEWEEYKWLPTWQGFLDEDWEIKDFQIVTLEEHPWRLKYKVSDENIIISSLKWAKSSAMQFENIDLSQYVFSNWFYIFKVKENWNKKFILYILKTKKLKDILDNHIYRWIWISAYKKQDLLKIKILNITLPTQNQIVSKIEPIEQKIKKLKDSIKDQKDIINEVFVREFWFDLNIVNEFGKWMTALTQSLPDRKLKINTIKLDELAKSEIFRCSTRFHNEPTQKLMNFLKTLKTIEVNKVVDSYEKWIQPKYDTDWEIDVIKISNLKNWYIDFTETEKVSLEYFNSLSEEKKLKENDIIFCATWKWSLWKIDLFEWENNTITSVDNYIIRINERKYNPLFFTYFFRSILWYFQVERDYTWATNQIHLYWDQIWNWKILDISLPDQQKIVNEIKEELDKQEQIKKNIEKERSKIDELIEEGIKNI